MKLTHVMQKLYKSPAGTALCVDCTVPAGLYVFCIIELFHYICTLNNTALLWK
jgi:hypothetical protein